MTVVLHHIRLHSVIAFQIYYIYINIDSLSQYIWTLVAPYYMGLIGILCYKILYIILLKYI